MPLTGERLVERMTDAERERARRVETVLPALREAAPAADAAAAFHFPHVASLREAGLLGLVVPERYGGLGGGLRDLAAATYAMGTACPSTALAFFFHNTSASRGCCRWRRWTRACSIPRRRPPSGRSRRRC
ncbi:acyl-CoA dehydrogenase family protein [Actinomadura yumaensis]|uniref:acyl-CoA dehydrogenase family protein n=1 Tax=Actinomadura yumaensis TaxID=111807 RepID=UPI003608FFE9